MVIDTDCRVKSKSNYHTITDMETHQRKRAYVNAIHVLNDLLYKSISGVGVEQTMGVGGGGADNGWGCKI